MSVWVHECMGLGVSIAKFSKIALGTILDLCNTLLGGLQFWVHNYEKFITLGFEPLVDSYTNSSKPCNKVYKMIDKFLYQFVEYSSTI